MKCFSCFGHNSVNCAVCCGTGYYLNNAYNESNEKYTHKRYIELARSVMGSIDLDPASSAIANKTVQATRYYTRQQDGLKQLWQGNVWLNPPYGLITNTTVSYQKLFINKAISEYSAGNINSCIMLLLGLTLFNPYADDLLNFSVCLDLEKTFFTKPDGTSFRYGYGTIFVYIGKDSSRFEDVFSAIGPIMVRKRKWSHVTTNQELV